MILQVNPKHTPRRRFPEPRRPDACVFWYARPQRVCLIPETLPIYLIHIYIYVYIYIDTHTRTYIYMYVHKRTHTIYHVYFCLSVYPSIYTYIYSCSHTCIHVPLILPPCRQLASLLRSTLRVLRLVLIAPMHYESLVNAVIGKCRRCSRAAARFFRALSVQLAGFLVTPRGTGQL